MVITLGHIATGIMGTDEKLIEKVKNSAENTLKSLGTSIMAGVSKTSKV